MNNSMMKEYGTPPEKVTVSENKAYITEIERLFGRIPVMEYNQLRKYLKKVFGDKAFRGNIDYAISEYLRRGILMSDGHYLFTKRIFDIAFQKQFRFNDLDYSSEIRVSEDLQLNGEMKEIIQCFDFVLETLPYSDDFFITEGLFPIMYIDREKNMLVQICHFSRENVIPLDMLIRNTSDFALDQRECISRIAIVDERKTADLIGYHGFSSIVMFDKTDEMIPMTVIQSRLHDRWG